MIKRSHTLIAVIFSLSIIGAFSLPAVASGALHTEGQYFVDTRGGTVLLRGVNATGDAKVPPFTVVSEPGQFTPLANWGMNVVRLLFNWEAYETAPGEFDESYYSYFQNVVDWASDAGLYVIIDIHQDAYSRFNIDGCGEGFPAWAFPPDLIAAEPDNSINCADWGFKMIFDSEMHYSWRYFHAGGGGARERYLQMMERLAATFANHPGVIGYDMLNEPWGNEKSELINLYEDAAKRIRQRDPNGILFVSPIALTSMGVPTRLPKPSFDNFVYSPHYYDPFLVALGEWFGFPITAAFNTMEGTARTWNVPLFLGEFGARGIAVTARRYLDAIYARLDRGFTSAAQWNYTPNWNPATKDGWNNEDFSIVDGTLETRNNFRLRPYPHRVAGIPQALQTRYEGFLRGARFSLSWYHHPELGETRIFLPRAAFFRGRPVTQTLQGEGLICDTVAGDEDYTECRADSEGVKTISLKSCVPFLSWCL